MIDKHRGKHSNVFEIGPMFGGSICVFRFVADEIIRSNIITMFAA